MANDDKKLGKLLIAAGEASAKKADLSATPTMKKLASKQEKRDCRVASYLRQSERDQFMELIGRETESNAIRDLILRFIVENKKKA